MMSDPLSTEFKAEDPERCSRRCFLANAARSSAAAALFVTASGQLAGTADAAVTGSKSDLRPPRGFVSVQLPKAGIELTDGVVIASGGTSSGKSNIVLIGTRSGEILRSVDGGQSFKLQKVASPGTPVENLASLRNGQVWATSPDGVLFSSIDQGGSWKKIELPSSMKAGPVLVSDVFAATGSNTATGVQLLTSDGRMYVTESMGRTWRGLNVSPLRRRDLNTALSSRSTFAAGLILPVFAETTEAPPDEALEHAALEHAVAPAVGPEETGTAEKAAAGIQESVEAEAGQPRVLKGEAGLVRADVDSDGNFVAYSVLSDTIFVCARGSDRWRAISVAPSSAGDSFVRAGWLPAPYSGPELRRCWVSFRDGTVAFLSLTSDMSAIADRQVVVSAEQSGGYPTVALARRMTSSGDELCALTGQGTLLRARFASGSVCQSASSFKSTCQPSISWTPLYTLNGGADTSAASPWVAQTLIAANRLFILGSPGVLLASKL
ncbi:hypothetical protein FVE85_0670 [Porphyridium purpureum]|uniref:Photosynthesis system II assembly factor Ycf48/Hcf136-like domain-containing protein n=1 Tax=Porphyridium purpureum TaxID=35688 RepID=A0A5J4YZ80_PORPP|nr:hypothetical protein FVE85_0670 [Porphyridium purpureum]|eukprot:POR7375..scf208_2